MQTSKQLPPTWLKVKTQIKAGSELKPGTGPGETDPRSRILEQLASRVRAS